MATQLRVAFMHKDEEKNKKVDEMAELLALILTQAIDEKQINNQLNKK